MQPTIHHIQLDGLTFRYLEFGEPGRGHQPTIVFYHATGFVSELWQPIIRELGDGCHTIALDQRGHGGSDQRAPSFTWVDTVADFQRFLTAMGLKGVIGIGHSSGATSIAVTAGREPERVERMVLIEPTLRSRASVGFTPEQRSGLVERTRKRRARWPSREAMIESLGARPPYQSWTEEMLRLFAAHATAVNGSGEVELLCSPETEAQIYYSFPDFDPWPDLARAQQPILVIHGTGATVLPTTPVAELMAVTPHARLVELAEGGHLILMEAPQRVANAIREFLI